MRKRRLYPPMDFDYRQALGRVTYVMGKDWTLRAMRKVGAKTMDDLKRAIQKEPPKKWYPRIFEAWHYVVHVRPHALLQHAIEHPGTALNIEDLAAGRVYAADVEDLMESEAGEVLREAVNLRIPIRGRLTMYRGK